MTSEANIKTIFETSIKTIEKIVEEKCEFIIPVYQRPYVWDDEEIKKLLEDILNAFTNQNVENSSYFVGNTYVIKKSDQSSKVRDERVRYELIDGQQRFTTFWLIAIAFELLKKDTEMKKYLEIDYSNNTKDIRFDFEIRSEVSHYLKSLLNNNSYLKFSDVSEKEFLKFIAKGVETIKNFIASEVVEEEAQINFANYIYKKVQFVFNVAPQNTDLNALFTALGTSGIQLQQSDILKASLLNKVSEKGSLITYSKMWEACEDMNNYFEKNVAGGFNIDEASIKSENFKFYGSKFFSIQDSSNTVKNNHLEKTISQIISSEETEIKDDTAKSERNSKCRSIISFNTFLIHAYRIFNLRKEKGHAKGSTDPEKKYGFETSIDPKKLFSTIKLDTCESEEFIELLCKLRFLFDKYVVKWRIEEDEDDDNDEKLLLTRITKTESDNNNKSYFSRTSSPYSPLQMLQSVLYFTGGFSQQYWLTPFLYYLLESETIGNEEQILTELEKIDNLMLPGGDKKESSLKLVSPTERNKKVDLKYLDDLNKEQLGTSFNHYWFYKLEYLLWKRLHNQNDPKIKKFRITSKNSIEHIYPQNPEFGEKLEKKWLDSFGNLGLLSVGENSSYSNQSVEKKKMDFKNKQTYDSLKLAKVYSEKSWEIADIKKHQEEMIKILHEHYKEPKN